MRCFSFFSPFSHAVVATSLSRHGDDATATHQVMVLVSVLVRFPYLPGHVPLAKAVGCAGRLVAGLLFLRRIGRVRLCAWREACLLFFSFGHGEVGFVTRAERYSLSFAACLAPCSCVPHSRPQVITRGPGEEACGRVSSCCIDDETAQHAGVSGC